MKTGMGIGVIIILVILGIFIFAGIIGLGYLYNVSKTCNTFEVGVKAQYEQNKNDYDNFFKKIKEMAQVPEMYVEDFKSIIDKDMEGRYGPDGSMAVFQWIQEHDIKLDAVLYLKIQQAIEAGRNQFAANQSSLIAVKQAYENYMADPLNGFVAKLLGYPKIDMNKYNIVTSEHTEKVFEEKKSEPLDLR